MFHKLKDERVECYSILVDMTIGDYLGLVERAYKKSGGIDGQRAPLKTKTGITIRQRLVSDIKIGAVIPPVVVGVLLPRDKYDLLVGAERIEDYLEAAGGSDGERISVIDGMQRTTALLTATQEKPDITGRLIRVEFWVAERVNSLIYRMLVLNTGQVPWEIGRQLETIYGQFVTQIRESVGDMVTLFQSDENRRRVQAGQYQSKNVIELLLIFSSRKSEIEVKDKVAEDFARLDAIETTAHTEFIDYFISTMRAMAELDEQFSRVTDFGVDTARIKSGKDIFSGFPAMAGFFTMVSIELFDEPGFAIDWAAAATKVLQIRSSFSSLAARMKAMDLPELANFMQISLLEERLSQRSGQVGRFERDLYRKAFSSMLRNSERLETLAPCWRA